MTIGVAASLSSLRCGRRKAMRHRTGGHMLSAADREAYRRDGFIVVPDILSSEEVAQLRAVTEQFVQNARSVAANDDVFDLEDTHSPAEPRVRRIKTPHLHHESYARLVRHPGIVAVLQDLWGPDLRFD